MSKANSETANKETSHVYDQYNGKDVVVQLRDPFVAVTAPGIVAQRPVVQQTPEGPQMVMMGPEGQERPVMEPVHTSTLPGRCEILKDDRGNVRVCIKYADPHPEQNGEVSSVFDPEDVYAISVVKEPSRIHSV